MNDQYQNQSNPTSFLLTLLFLAMVLVGAGFVFHELESKKESEEVAPSRMLLKQSFLDIDFENGFSNLRWGTSRTIAQSILPYKITSSTEDTLIIEVPVADNVLPLSLNFEKGVFSSMTFLTVFPQVPDFLPGTPQYLAFEILSKKAHSKEQEEGKSIVYRIGNTKFLKLSIPIQVTVITLYQTLVIIKPYSSKD